MARVRRCSDTARSENLEAVDSGLIASSYGGRSPHERSHGESFLALAVHRFGLNVLYLTIPKRRGCTDRSSPIRVDACITCSRRSDQRFLIEGFIGSRGLWR